MNNNYGLAINNDVIARMAEMAALETKGVAGMGVKPANIKNLFNKNGGTKGVSVSTEHGIINIEIYVKVLDNEKVSDIAERVQSGVKEKLQGMTGSAVTKVNVVVTDIDFAEEKEEIE